MLNKKGYTVFSLGCLLLFAGFTTEAQQLKPLKVEVYYDGDAIPELFPQVPVGFTFIYSNGSKSSTRGILRGRINWRALNIQSDEGEIKDGNLIFDFQKVWENNHRVHFRIAYADTVLTCDLHLPYVKNIRFNLYTDSIKKEVPYYINVEGVFSNDKVYPLDTMRLKFENSAGKLKGNILQISDSDTIRDIQVSASFKWDSAMKIETGIPVKQYIENVHLQTKDEVMQQIRKGRRRN